MIIHNILLLKYKRNYFLSKEKYPALEIKISIILDIVYQKR